MGKIDTVLQLENAGGPQKEENWTIFVDISSSPQHSHFLGFDYIFYLLFVSGTHE